MGNALTAKEAASQLGTSKPTVRSLIEKKSLHATRQIRGSGFRWLIDEDSVKAFLSEHGRYDERVPGTRHSLKSIDGRLSTLEVEVRRLSAVADTPGHSDQVDTTRVLDDARARIVNLEEALVRSRTSAELQREADDARSVVVEHLLAAVAAAELADGLRRRAYAQLDEAVQGFSRPGHPGELRDT